jgi:fucose permease
MSEQSRFSCVVVLLHLEFVLTGLVTTLIGPLVPFFVTRCSMSDQDAGLLIAAQFAGNFVGALFATRNLSRSILTGLPLIAIGVAALSFVPCTAKDLCAACYGMGLGLTILPINLVIARHWPVRRARSLSLLNFLWGAGALGSPILVGWSHRHHRVSEMLIAIALSALGLWLATMSSTGFSIAPLQKGGPDSVCHARSLFLYAALFFMYIGVESSVGNWASPYALRILPTRDGIGILSVTCFWSALLTGRVVCAIVLKHASERLVYHGSLALTVAGVSLLVAAQSPGEVLVAALITGFGLAPVFPLLLSFASGSLLSSRSSGWVFSCAALGGVALPWLTGWVSTRSNSLRAGLTVPAFATILMAALSLAARGRRA